MEKYQYRQLSDVDKAKQLERRNKPSAIANRLMAELSYLEAPGTRYTGVLENLATSIQRCQQEGKPFTVDTIVCPMGILGKAESPTIVSGNVSSLEEGGRFQRCLVSIAGARGFFGALDRPIPVVVRIYYGDAGIVGINEIKKKFGVSSDEEMRKILDKEQENYQKYFDQHSSRLGLEGAKYSFHKLTDIAPELRSLPLDLYELANASGIFEQRGTSVSIDSQKLRQACVDEKIITGAQHAALERTMARHAKGEHKEGVVKQTYLEIAGYLHTYGKAKLALVKQEQKTDLLVTGDSPGNYRNDFYYTFLGSKGKDLSIFTPASVDNLRRKGVL